MSSQAEGALGMAEAIGNAHKEGMHGRPDWWVEEIDSHTAKLIVMFGGTDEYPPSTFEITVVQTRGDK